MSRWDYYDYGRFPKSVPRAAKGGIRAETKKGNFGQTWWAKRWIAVLEGFQLGSRLTRGRSYARQGQVLSIAVDKGQVKAQVQGSRPNPYRVTMLVKSLSTQDWQKLAKEVSHQAIFGAKLLGGEMPKEIEDAFQKAELSLFPKTLHDVETMCSCPDWSNPCKHTAAVYYLLGEEFDRDPFLIFKLRGMERQEFLELLGEERQPAGQGPSAEKELLPGEPLSPAPSIFWAGGALPDDLIGEAQPGFVTAALPRRLGKFPFWRGREGFFEALEPVYSSASAKAVQILNEEAVSNEMVKE